MQINNSAGEHAEKDFDLLKIIKKLRLHKTQLKTLLSRSERQMSKRLADKATMADTSSSDFSDLNNDNGRDKDTENQLDFNENKFKYFDDITADLKIPTHRRLI